MVFCREIRGTNRTGERFLALTKFLIPHVLMREEQLQILHEEKSLNCWEGSLGRLNLPSLCHLPTLVSLR